MDLPPSPWAWRRGTLEGVAGGWAAWSRPSVDGPALALAAVAVAWVGREGRLLGQPGAVWQPLSVGRGAGIGGSWSGEQGPMLSCWGRPEQAPGPLAPARPRLTSHLLFLMTWCLLPATCCVPRPTQRLCVFTAIPTRTHALCAHVPGETEAQSCEVTFPRPQGGSGVGLEPDLAGPGVSLDHLAFAVCGCLDHLAQHVYSVVDAGGGWAGPSREALGFGADT